MASYLDNVSDSIFAIREHFPVQKGNHLDIAIFTSSVFYRLRCSYVGNVRLPTQNSEEPIRLLNVRTVDVNGR